MSTSNQSQSLPWMDWPLPSWFFGRPAPSVSGTFEQPINPGWTFGNISVTEQNSSAPDTERDIVATESYGRQLGRVIDAVAELIAEQPQSLQEKPALHKLIELRDEIEKIKTRAAARRLEHVTADLARLKRNHAQEYQDVMEKLRRALGEVS
jgi:hypothetical protein